MWLITYRMGQGVERGGGTAAWADQIGISPLLPSIDGSMASGRVDRLIRMVG